MENLVLAAGNHVTFTSSIWASWASAPHDLLLVAEDGVIEAHSKILLPLSNHLAAVVVEARPCSGPTSVVLAGRSIKAVTAVRDLIYTGLCHLDELILPEILETLSVLGIEVSSNSFNIKSEHAKAVGDLSTDPNVHDFRVAPASSDVLLENVKVEVSDVGGAIGIKGKTEGLMNAFEGITVESIWSTRHEEKSDKSYLSRFKEMVHNKERSHQCIQCLKKFGESRGLTRHIEAVHNKERPHACPEPGCAQKFGQKFNLKRHLMLVHNFEKPFPCAEQNCDKKFGDRRDLKDHYRSAHGAAKLVCGFENCAATFAARRSLLEHKNKEKHISVK